MCVGVCVGGGGGGGGGGEEIRRSDDSSRSQILAVALDRRE